MIAKRSKARRSKGAKQPVDSRLNIDIIEGSPEENQVPLVLLEGDQASLEYLGKFILAHARAPKDCGIQIGPRRTQRLAFRPDAKFGIYVHLLPCWTEEAKRNAVSSVIGKARKP